MEFGEIFSNALKYPLSDYTKLLIIGLIFVLSGLTSILGRFGYYNSTLTFIWTIVTLILCFLLLGFGLSVIKESIGLGDAIPDFDWIKNIVDGIKYLIVAIVYYLIPAIITFIVAMALGAGPLAKIFTQQNVAIFSMGNATLSRAVLTSIPPQTFASLFTAISVTAVLGCILFIIFGVFVNVAICRLAKYDSIGEAFNFGEVWSDIKEIGFFKIVLFIILLAIIAAIISIVIGFVSAVPFIGIIIAYLFGNSYLMLFTNRALGLLYSEV